jgi:hypothetical protein
MHFEAFSFGSIRIDGITYDHDVVIDRGHVRERKKKPTGFGALSYTTSPPTGLLAARV